MAPLENAILDTRFDASAPDSDAARQIVDALTDLPPGSRDAVFERLTAVVANYDQTRQVDPVIHFMESLLMTARLHRNQAYCDSLAEAEASRMHGEPGGTGDVADFMTALRERRAR